jgi:hypothetical protein
MVCRAALRFGSWKIEKSTLSLNKTTSFAFQPFNLILSPPLPSTGSLRGGAVSSEFATIRIHRPPTVRDEETRAGRRSESALDHCCGGVSSVRRRQTVAACGGPHSKDQIRALPPSQLACTSAPRRRPGALSPVCASPASRPPDHVTRASCSRALPCQNHSSIADIFLNFEFRAIVQVLLSLIC